MVQAIQASVASGIFVETPTAPAGANVDPHDVIAGGTNSAFPLPVDICIDRAAGSRIWDEQGREYIDFILSSGPLILGHSHPRVVEAVTRQATRGFAYNVLNRPAVELAAKLVNMPGCVERVRFASTGTEATMHAIRLARAFTGREMTLVFRNSYHGSHGTSLVAYHGPVRARTGGIPMSEIEHTVVADFNNIASVERAFIEHEGQIGAVIIEPQQRSRDPLPDFLPRLVDLCRAAGAVLIFDEVLTGFRLAYGGAQEYYGVQPDLACYGKIMGGGMPISAIGGREEIMRLADPRNSASPSFVHISGTLSGNPIAAAAGLATLAELEAPGVYDRLHQLGARLRAGLNARIQAAGVPGSAYGSGPIAAIQFDDTGGPGSGQQLRSAVNREMILRGILVQMQTRFYVSLAHTEAEIDSAVETFGEALRSAIGQPEVPQAQAV